MIKYKLLIQTFSNFQILPQIYYENGILYVTIKLLTVILDHVNYFEDFFESIEEYRKLVIKIFLNEDDKNLLRKIGFSERDIERLN